MPAVPICSNKARMSLVIKSAVNLGMTTVFTTPAGPAGGTGPCHSRMTPSGTIVGRLDRESAHNSEQNLRSGVQIWRVKHAIYDVFSQIISDNRRFLYF